jgi:hypothetical protein
MTTPDDLERRYTLATAVVRYDELRTRDALAGTAGWTGESDPDERDAATAVAGPDKIAGLDRVAGLDREEALELLALGELIARKAGYGRQLAVRSARAAGASWSQIGEALGTSKQSAWEAHSRWIEQQAAQYRRLAYTGLGEEAASAARARAGSAAEEEPG